VGDTGFEQARTYAAPTRPDRTKSAYASEWADFTAWADEPVIIGGEAQR
jgi:hypothetical protein